MAENKKKKRKQSPTGKNAESKSNKMLRAAVTQYYEMLALRKKTQRNMIIWTILFFAVFAVAPLMSYLGFETNGNEMGTYLFAPLFVGMVFVLLCFRDFKTFRNANKVLDDLRKYWGDLSIYELVEE